jgi:predicted PurR-regulated permease PerM
MSIQSSKSLLFRWASFLVIASLVVYIMIIGRSVIIPLMFAGFVAVLFSPISTWLDNNKFPRWLSSLICLIAALVVIAGIITFFYSQSKNFTGDLETLGDSLNKLISDFTEWLNDTTGNQQLLQLNTLQEALGALLQGNSNMITQGLAQATASFIQILLFMTFLVSFLIYRDDILKFLLMALNGNDNHIRGIILKVKNVVRNYIIGILLVIGVLAFFNSIALLAMGIEHAIFFAVFAAVLNIVPFIGPLIGSVFPAIFALVMKDSLWYPFGVILYFIVIQSFESYLITPHIVGRKVSVNPMFTILAIFIGNMIWGVAGMILFIPLTAMLKQIFDEIDHLKPYGYIMGGMNAKKSRE